jgi:hypothetical protein
MLQSFSRAEQSRTVEDPRHYTLRIGGDFNLLKKINLAIRPFHK